MREVKYRQLVDSKWHYFGFTRNVWTGPITSDPETFETIGQFTGFKDKNSVEIFEGDIWKREVYIGAIEFKSGQWILVVYIFDTPMRFLEFPNKAGTGKVIGNIYENSDLLKEVQNGNGNN